MGKDRMGDNMAKNLEKWEKRKEKMDKKAQTERGSVRKGEKDQKKLQKEEEHREQKEGIKVHKNVDRKINMFRSIATTSILGLYLLAMAFILRQEAEPTGELQGSADGTSWLMGFASSLPTALTALVLLAMTAVAFGGEVWRERLVKEEELREAASHIKGQLERKQTEKEREEGAQERRLQLQKEARERLLRRAAEDAAQFLQAQELARGLRRRREERQAAEAKQVRVAEAAADAQGEVDAHGWTARQRRKLQEAVARYPEGWSRAKMKRWEMIAVEVDADGQGARACEEAFLRLEADRAAAAENAKAEAEKRGGTAQAASSGGLDGDLDWLGDADEAWDGTTAGEYDDSDAEEEEEEEEEAPRMAVELEPEHKGTEIRLEGIKAMLGCATVQVELLHLQLACAECRSVAQVYLSGADEDAAAAKTWCEGCSGLLSVRLRPTLLHRGASSPRLCYVDCVRCAVTDVLPSVLMSVCENCNAANVHKQEFVRNRVMDGVCFGCHTKYAFGAESIRIDQVTLCDMGSGGRGGGPRQPKSGGDGDEDPMDEIAEELRWLRKKAKSDPRQLLIQLGRQLPQMGACAHFKKSFKWYRFACCGRAFPCPECHVESGCPAAALGAHASRMICGKCSLEQSYSPARPCEKCNFAMQAKGSSHWESGAGTRNLAAMSTKDAKKFKGGLKQVNSKTKTSSAKAERVGAKAKAKREHEKKFGGKDQ
ncbi:unnamed protein product [Polarella glacialis]|uniref:CHY-type domain-containing protein n=1 Tax=Polarella glacialis TaxID=89957 RepID=A0A813J2Y2_POLGL|nr:unnamed protein product [Polarella glacialis]